MEEQLVLRVQAAAAAVFLLLLLLCLSGCAASAVRSHAVLKFLSVPILAVAFLPVPNGFFDVFGAVASGAAALFLVVQAVLVIDLAYAWNESWFSKALAARRGAAGSRGNAAWRAAILAAAAAALAAAVAGSVSLFVLLPGPATAWVLGLALAVGAVELLLSITEWCEHGALLTSSVVLAYAVWLAYEALALAPSTGVPAWMRWVELAICAVTLFALARRTRLGGATASGTAAGGDAEAGEAAPAPADRSGEEAAPAAGGAAPLALDCAAHAAAALYVASALAPFQSWATFGVRTAALAASLAAYGWSLLAPRVLTRRSFV